MVCKHLCRWVLRRFGFFKLKQTTFAKKEGNSISKNNIGTQLEELGWRQGSVVNSKDIDYLLRQKDGFTYSEVIDNKSVILVVASQSCDVANNNIKDDPFIELSISRRVEVLNGNLTFNKNPRTLHTTLQHKTEDITIIKEILIELKAYEKIQLKKERLVGLSPNEAMVL